MNRVAEQHAATAEHTILGGILGRCIPVQTVASYLAPEDFSELSHSIIYATALRLGSEADLITVTDALIQDGKLDAAGGAEMISDLCGGLPWPFSLPMAENYCRIIQRNAQHRRLVKLGAALLKAVDAEQKDPETLAGLAKDHIHKIESRLAKNRILSGHEMAQIEERDLARRLDPKNAGVRTGVIGVDAGIGNGLQPGSLWIVGGRPSVGKSTFLAGAAANAATHERQVLYVACEMGEPRNIRRLLSVKSMVPLTKITTWHSMTGEENRAYLKAFSWLDSSAQLRLTHHPGITPSELEGAILQTRALMGGLDFVVVDYFQMMGADRHYKQHYDTRAECVRDVARLAGRMNVALMLGWQLSRDAEGLGENDLPSLKDLSETQGAEQAATGVILLHRWNLYDREQQEAKALIAKNQDGPRAVVSVRFDQTIPRWE